MTIIKENENNLEILNRNHFHEYFNTEAYLKDFYSKIEDPAMQLIIFHLPSILARLPLNINYLLDFGSGPTIYVAICFREKAKNIFLSDYLPQNRNELKLWLNGNSNFNWTNLIAVHEAIPPPSFSDFTKMEQMAREKVRDIIHCDCHISPSIQLNSPKYFDVITTFLTIEYCCLNKEEYKNAIKRLSALLVPKEGILIMGGVLEETWCAFGGHRFSCLYIKKEFLLNTLEEAGLEIFKDSIGTKLFYERDGIFLLVAKKVIEEKNEENYEEIRMKG